MFAKYLTGISFLLFALVTTEFITLQYQQELYVALVEICQIGSLYMNFSFVSSPATVDFLVYPGGQGPSFCDPNTIETEYPHSDGLTYYSQFSCASLATNHCNITKTAAIISGPTCFTFYNRYYKGPLTISYQLQTNCSQSQVQLQTISMTPVTIHGPANFG